MASGVRSTFNQRIQLASGNRIDGEMPTRDKTSANAILVPAGPNSGSNESNNSQGATQS